MKWYTVLFEDGKSHTYDEEQLKKKFGVSEASPNQSLRHEKRGSGVVLSLESRVSDRPEKSSVGMDQAALQRYVRARARAVDAKFGTMASSRDFVHMPFRIPLRPCGKEMQPLSCFTQSQSLLPLQPCTRGHVRMRADGRPLGMETWLMVRMSRSGRRRLTPVC